MSLNSLYWYTDFVVGSYPSYPGLPVFFHVARRFFSMQHWKTREGLGTRLMSWYVHQRCSYTCFSESKAHTSMQHTHSCMITYTVVYSLFLFLLQWARSVCLACHWSGHVWTSATEQVQVIRHLRRKEQAIPKVRQYSKTGSPQYS